MLPAQRLPEARRSQLLSWSSQLIRSRWMDVPRRGNQTESHALACIAIGSARSCRPCVASSAQPSALSLSLSSPANRRWFVPLLTVSVRQLLPSPSPNAAARLLRAACSTSLSAQHSTAHHVAYQGSGVTQIRQGHSLLRGVDRPVKATGGCNTLLQSGVMLCPHTSCSNQVSCCALTHTLVTCSQTGRVQYNSPQWQGRRCGHVPYHLKSK